MAAIALYSARGHYLPAYFKPCVNPALSVKYRAKPFKTFALISTPFTMPNPENIVSAAPLMTPEAHLIAARRLHWAFTVRAAKVWALLSDAQAAKVRVPREQVLSTLCASMYYSDRYCAAEIYASESEFEEALGDELDASEGFKYTTEEGVAFYVLTPAFRTDLAYASKLGISYLTGYCSINDLDVLNVVPAEAPPTETVSGLTAAELVVLTKHYHRETLQIVNALRKLETSLHYLRSGVAAWKARMAKAGRDQVQGSWFKLDAPWDPTLESLVLALEPLASLGLMPAVAPHFGTDADRINPLSKLPPNLHISELDS